MSYEIKTTKHHHSLGKDLFDELFTKEAYVSGATAPELVESGHGGIPYATRRSAYMRYVNQKSKEGHTPLGKALFTGAGIGAGLGGLAGAVHGDAATGLAVGGVVGGAVGAMLKIGDDAEIAAAKKAVKGGKGVVDEMLAARMAYKHDIEKAERRVDTLMLASAVSRPRTVNNYNTRVNAISVRNNVRSNNIVKVGSAAVGGLVGGAIGGGLGYASSKKNRMRNTLLGAGAGAAIGAGIGFKPSMRGGGGSSSAIPSSSKIKFAEGDNVLTVIDGKLLLADRSGNVLQQIANPPKALYDLAKKKTRVLTGGNGSSMSADELLRRLNAVKG